MKSLEKKILDLNTLKIEDRSFSDLINLVSQISKEINLYNSDNIVSDKFFSMFSHDNTFLVSEILKYNIDDLKFTRNKLIKKYDTSEKFKSKVEILLDFIILTKSFFDKISDWYKRSFSKDLIIDSNINFEIESIIKKHASKQLASYNNIIRFILKEISEKEQIKIIKYQEKIWLNTENKSDMNYLIKKNKIDVIDNLFKNMILINNSLINIIDNIVVRSKKKFKNSLENKSHNPHIGLLFSFLNLYKHLTNDINLISKKHLDYYYYKILGQKKFVSAPNKTFAVFKIDPNISEINLNKGQIINAGQYSDGSGIEYIVDEDMTLNNAQLSSIRTIFLSNSSINSFDSRYRLISAVYSKLICRNIEEVENFNNNSNVFNALGKDQNFISNQKTKMNYANLGFILGSSCLKLSNTKREIIIDFIFESSSVKQLTDLIIDISNNSQLNENEVFYKIFSDAFFISYSYDEGWFKIDDYEVIMPDDWSKNTLSISIKLGKSHPSFMNYKNTIHGMNIDSNNPLIMFKINQNSFYNPYAFLNKMKMKQVNIKSKVSNLSNFKIFSNKSVVSDSSEFDFFGSIPKNNSNIHIACEELFNKKIDDFNISWNYINLEDVQNNLVDYYKGYGRSFAISEYKLKLSFLSDYRYINYENMIFPMFDFDSTNNIDDKKSHSVKDFNNIQISPNFNLNTGDITTFNKDYDSGIIKLQLTCPTFAFGHKSYPKIYSESVSQNMINKSGKLYDENINEPYSPQISDINIDYAASTIMYFDQENINKNDYDEGNIFLHLSPYGIQNTFSKKNINNSMFYELHNDGELIIGIKSAQKLKNLDLFFEIVKNENEFYDFSSKIKWQYVSKNGWKTFDDQFILNDQTNNLINSGVISFIFPKDISVNKEILSGKEFYIKAISKDKADQLGLIKSVFTNACSTTEVIPSENSVRLPQLKENSFQGLQKNVSGIISVSQPIPSPMISLSESDDRFYERTSNLLKHKNRPVSKSEFENFIKDNFKNLSYVKCIDNDDNILTFVCLKKINETQNIDEIKLTPQEIKNILLFINKYKSPNFDIKIINPVFEDVLIKASIKFNTANPGRAISIFNKELLAFICPWKSSESVNYIYNSIKNIDILNFVKSRKYIDYVTGFSIIHFKKDESGNIIVYDSASENHENDFISKGSNKSIIVPRNRHIIKVLNSNEYEIPSKINYEDLEIDDTFISTKEINKNQLNQISSEEKKYDNLQFTLK